MLPLYIRMLRCPVLGEHRRYGDAQMYRHRRCFLEFDVKKGADLFFQIINLPPFSSFFVAKISMLYVKKLIILLQPIQCKNCINPYK